MMSAVLIETLWNVKIAKVYQIDEKSRINRNIVECKDRSKKLVTYWLQSINRNIVECKEKYEKKLKNGFRY